LQRDPHLIIAGCDQLELIARQGLRELEVAQRSDGNSTRSDISRIKQCSDPSAGRRLHPRRPLGIGEIRHAPQKVIFHVASITTRLMTKLWSQMGRGWDWAARETTVPQIDLTPGSLAVGRDMLAPWRSSA
jgi:hypothetical protein